jgi:hypothetical protein
MKGADWVSLAIGAVVLYILYEWMQGASKASGAVTNTLQSAPVFQSVPPLQSENPAPRVVSPSPSECASFGGTVNASGGCTFSLISNINTYPASPVVGGLLAQ